jgi:hypothetical protein
MTRHDMLIKRIREVRAAGLYDDPNVIHIAYNQELVPSWVSIAIAEGWATVKVRGGADAYTLTAQGQAFLDAAATPGRPRLTREQKAAREADRLVEALTDGARLYGVEWLKAIVKRLKPVIMLGD